MPLFDQNRLEVWTINLESRPDRLAQIQKEAVKTGLKLHRWPAFTKDDYRGPSQNVVNMMHTANTIGNWLSHTRLIGLAALRDKDIVVLEDDALVCADFPARMRYLETNLRWDWDIIFLGATFHLNPPVWHKDDIGRDVETTEAPHLLRAYGVWSNHGYIVNAKSAERIVETMNRVMPESKGSDHALIKVQPELNCYVFVPGAVFQRDGVSDIGQGVTTFSHFLNLGPYVYCERMEDFDFGHFDWKEARK